MLGWKTRRRSFRNIAFKRDGFVVCSRVTTNEIVRFMIHTFTNLIRENSAIYLQDAIRLEDCLYNEYLFIKIVMRVKIYEDLVLSENQDEIKNERKSQCSIHFVSI
ncbi:hypothetical protein P5V15_007673 [Pogonomyrmex californicus]